MLPLEAALDLIVIGLICVGMSDCLVEPDLGLHKAQLLVLWAATSTMLGPKCKIAVPECQCAGLPPSV